MIGNKIKKRIAQKDEINKELLLQEDKKARKEQERKLNLLKDIIENIKINAKKIADGKKEIQTSRSGWVFVGDTKHLSHSDKYDKFIHSDKAQKSFFDKYKIEEYPTIVGEFKKWTENNNISDIIISYNHDGIGRESWNEYLLKLD